MTEQFGRNHREMEQRRRTKHTKNEEIMSQVCYIRLRLVGKPTNENATKGTTAVRAMHHAFALSTSAVALHHICVIETGSPYST